MRPDCPIMVPDGIISTLPACHCAYPPPGEESLAHQVPYAGLDLVVIDYLAPEQVPNI